MYHVRGQKFSNVGEVKQKVSTLGERWSNKHIPSICQFAKETEEPPPASDLPNGNHDIKYMYAGITAELYVLMQSCLCTA